MAAAAAGESSSRSTIARDSQRTASWACSTSDGGSWSKCRRLEERRGDVVDGRQPLLGGVAVCVAVELEGPVTAVERAALLFSALRSNWSMSATAPVAGRTWITWIATLRLAQAGTALASRAIGRRMRWSRSHSGRCSARRCGVAVVIGELLVRPATCELVVGGGEVAHGSVREHDVNAPAPAARGRPEFPSSGTRPARPHTYLGVMAAWLIAAIERLPPGWASGGCRCGARCCSSPARSRR